MSVVYAALALLLIAVSLGAFLFMNRVILRPLRSVGESFDKIAAGDLTTRVEVNSTNEIGQLFAAVKRMQESLTRTVSAVRRGVDEINVGSREISAGNTDLSSRTEEQAASLEETAASMEQLASTVKQNADNARQANQLAASASDGRARRFGGVGSGDDDAGNLGQLAQDFRDRVGDRRHRIPDQHPGAERGGGSGAGGRAGQGFAVVAGGCARWRSAAPRPPRKSRA